MVILLIILAIEQTKAPCVRCAVSVDAAKEFCTSSLPFDNGAMNVFSEQRAGTSVELVENVRS